MCLCDQRILVLGINTQRDIKEIFGISHSVVEISFRVFHFKVNSARLKFFVASGFNSSYRDVAFNSRNAAWQGEDGKVSSKLSHPRTQRFFN